MVFRNPQLLLLLALIPLFAAGWFMRRGRIPGLALAMRVVMLALVVLAIADPVTAARPSQPRPQLVLVVDQSDSLGDEGRAALIARAELLARSQAGRTQVIFFGANAVARVAQAPAQS